MGLYSRNKGKRGEREVAALLRKYGFAARRGQQFAGGSDSPDVVSERFPFHIEVKFTESLSVPAWIRKAREDSAGKPVCVFHRRTREQWTVHMTFDDMQAGFRQINPGIESETFRTPGREYVSTPAEAFLATLEGHQIKTIIKKKKQHV